MRLWLLGSSGASAAIAAMLVALTASSVIASLAVAMLVVIVAVLVLHARRNDRVSGSAALVVASVGVVLFLGNLGRSDPVFSVNPSAEGWLVSVVGLLGLVAGLLCWRVAEPEDRRDVLESSVRSPRFAASSGRLLPVFLLANGVAVVNYATGDIPLLSGDINRARFAGDYGVLGAAWPLLIPVLQVAVVCSLLSSFRASRSWVWPVLGASSALALILSGGRSLIVIAVLCFFFVVAEFVRMKVWWLAPAAVAAAAFAYLGDLRRAGSEVGRQSAEFLEKRGLDDRWGALDVSLQAGPRVLTRAMDVPGVPLHGRFLLSDMLNFARLSPTSSDRLVTQLLGQDPDVVGGLPPTIFGGFYLDFGFVGVVLLSLLVGAVLGASRVLVLRSPSPSTVVWFGYLCAYLSISSYSYVSVRPSWVVVLILCLVVLREPRHGRTSADGVEVPDLPRRGREPHRGPGGRSAEPWRRHRARVQ